MDPFPEVMIFEITWGTQEVRFTELAQIYISIAESF